MEIRAAPIAYAKRKAGEKRDKKCLLARFNQFQEQLRVNYDETIKYGMEHVKSKLAKIVSIKRKKTVNTFSTLKNKTDTDRQKHIKALKKEDGTSENKCQTNL